MKFGVSAMISIFKYHIVVERKQRDKQMKRLQLVPGMDGEGDDEDEEGVDEETMDLLEEGEPASTVASPERYVSINLGKCYVAIKVLVF